MGATAIILLLAVLLGAVAHGRSIATAPGLAAPEQVALAYTGKPSEASVSWFVPQASRDAWQISAATTGSDGPGYRVLFGASPAALDKAAPVKNVNIDAATGAAYEAVLTGLEPETRVFYAVQDAAGALGAVFNFTTAPRVGSRARFAVAILADMGIINSGHTLAALKATASQYAFLLHAGDVSYADDWDLQWSTYDRTFDKYRLEMEPLTATKAYMVAPGNHEATCSEWHPFLCPAHQRNFTYYRSRYFMPHVRAPYGSPAQRNMWYSFDYANVHFVQISTETDFPGAPEAPRARWIQAGPFGDQLTWLEEDLAEARARVDAGEIDWIVVSGHRPPYSTDPGESPDVRAAFSPLFDKYGVHVSLSGHVHWSEEVAMMYAGLRVSVQDGVGSGGKGTKYLVVGGAGNVEGFSRPPRSIKPYTEWINREETAYAMLTVHGAQSLEWNFIGSKSQRVLRSITIPGRQ